MIVYKTNKNMFFKVKLDKKKKNIRHLKNMPSSGLLGMDFSLINKSIKRKHRGNNDG